MKDRASYPVGCPLCMDRRVCPTNSVRALYPSVAKEWHPTRNDDTPDDYLKGANKKAWWKCGKGHVWEARINARTIYGQGCPKCAKEAQKERERATTARRHRRNRQLAAIAKSRAGARRSSTDRRPRGRPALLTRADA